MRQSDLQLLYEELLSQLRHHGLPPEQMPLQWREIAEALQRECDRRGFQPALF